MASETLVSEAGDGPIVEISAEEPEKKITAMIIFARREIFSPAFFFLDIQIIADIPKAR